METEDFKLPASSLEEIEKIVHSYYKLNKPSSNDDVGKLAGLTKETVSRNNGFLVSVGVIKGGNKKEITDLGQKLGHALDHGEDDEVRKFWKEAIADSSFLGSQLTAVRIQKGISKEELPGKILYNSGATNNQYSKTGANAVTDLLEKTGLIIDEDGTFFVSKGTSPRPVASDTPLEKVVERQPNDSNGSHAPGKDVRKRDAHQARPPFQLAVNLQIQITEFDDPKKYDDLFKALRRNLLDGSSDEEL